MDKMIDALRVQGAMIKLLAMVGGAETVEDYPDYSKFLDKDWQLSGPRAKSVSLWAEYAAME